MVLLPIRTTIHSALENHRDVIHVRDTEARAYISQELLSLRIFECGNSTRRTLLERTPGGGLVSPPH